MAFLSDETWERHTNPWSGWSRVLAMPGLAIGLYFHSLLILSLVAAWLLVNPMIFRKPKSTDNWMSKGVLGERLYYKEGKKFKRDLPTMLNIVNLPMTIAFVYFGWQQELVPLVLSALLVMTIKFWFLDRMVVLYERTRR